jgi:hypothetical protein
MSTVQHIQSSYIIGRVGAELNFINNITNIKYLYLIFYFLRINSNDICNIYH